MNNLKYSIVIVTKNRREELEVTLNKISDLIDSSLTEILVLVDGSKDETFKLQEKFKAVNWTILKQSVGASYARSLLYKKAKGDIFIGLDDDSHPLQYDFIQTVEDLFREDKSLGIIAFQEIKGVFENDIEALNSKSQEPINYYCNEFVGCGFAIKRESYLATRGFPKWIDIYGEESCLAIEVLANKENILFTNSISVNHRVDLEARKQAGQNYFRFEKQLKNTILYYSIYYKRPFLKIAKLLFHNFIKYAIKDFSFFKAYFAAIFKTFTKLPLILNYRKPVAKEVILKKDKLPSPIFH